MTAETILEMGGRVDRKLTRFVISKEAFFFSSAKTDLLFLNLMIVFRKQITNEAY